MSISRSNLIAPDHDSPQREALVRTAAVRGMTALALAHLTAAMVVAATPAHAENIDFANADSSEVRAHVDDLVRDHASAEREIDHLEAEQSELSALIDQANRDFGTIEAQLTQATEAVSTANDDLPSKIESLAELRIE